MNEHILLCVSTVDETITTLDVEPFNHTGYLSRDDLLLLLRNRGFVVDRRLCFRLLLLLLLLGLRLLLLRRWRLLGLLLRRLRLLFWRTYCWLVSHVVIVLPRFPHSRQYTFFELEKLRCW